MKLRKVKPSDIKVPEVRVTAQFDEELYQQFRGSLDAIGQITPIIVYEVGESLILCDGLHRLQEAKDKGAPTIDAIVIPGDEVDVLTRNLTLDHLRGKPRVSEMVQVIGILYQDYHLDPDQIAEKTFKNREYIEKLIRISQASPSVQQALDQGIIGVGHAFELSRLPYAIQQEEVMAKHQVWRFTVKELKEQVDGVLKELELIKTEPPVAPTTETPRPRTFTCEGCHEIVEPRYLRPVMVCPNCFGEVWRLSKVQKPVEVKNSKEGGGA